MTIDANVLLYASDERSPRHDAAVSHVAALMHQHGVSTIFAADRDFRRFPGITAHDPSAGASGPATR